MLIRGQSLRTGGGVLGTTVFALLSDVRVIKAMKVIVLVDIELISVSLVKGIVSGVNLVPGPIGRHAAGRGHNRGLRVELP